MTVACILTASVAWQWQWQRTLPLERVVIADSAQPMSTLLYVALEKGYFREQGLQITLQNNVSGKAALASVIDGQADIATAANTPLVTAILAGKHVYVVASMHNTDKNVSIVARKNSDITDSTSLRGKRIAFTPATDSAFFLNAYLITHQMSASDVSMVALEPPKLIDALVNGSVDAVSTWTSNRLMLQKMLLNQVVILNSPGLYTDHWNLVTKQEFARFRPATICQLLRAIIKAEAYVKQNPGDAVRIAAAHLKLDPVVLTALWPDLNFQVGLDQVLLISLESQAKIISRDHPTFPANGILDSIYIDAMQAIDPARMTVIH